jgi:hypothetical protein
MISLTLFVFSFIDHQEPVIVLAAQVSQEWDQINLHILYDDDKFAQRFRASDCNLFVCSGAMKPIRYNLLSEGKLLSKLLFPIFLNIPHTLFWSSEPMFEVMEFG